MFFKGRVLMKQYINYFVKFITDPKIRFGYLSSIGFYNNISDEKYIKKEYYVNMEKKLDLDNVKTFDEKLQWLKLNDHKDIYTTLVDKYKVKEYISEKLGEKYIIKTIGVWNDPEEINFESLPDKFVLKVTHDSGGVVICKDKNIFDKDKAVKILKKSLSRDYYKIHREWPYKNVEKRIIAEEYVEDDNTKELRDYKFYAFNGHVEAMLLATNRQSKIKELNFDYFDSHGQHLNLINYWHPNADVTPELPTHFDEMVKLAKKLSKGFPHVRVDFYEANDRVYFGELTFYDMGGYLKLKPENWEYEWGDLIDLSLVEDKM